MVLIVIAFLSIPSVPIVYIQPLESSYLASDEPLSIILMIGDGMGYEHVELARLVEFGESGSLIMQDSDWNATVTTYSANAEVTDSSAAATAIATGNKTNNGFVAMSPTLVPLETILEYAQTLNKSTGIVATTILNHATPASFMTHCDSRNNYPEIARQIVEEASVDVLLGGGSAQFSGSQISMMSSNGYSVVYNRTELNAITTGKVFGLFSSSDMAYEYDRDYAVQPSIAEMTNKSLQILSQDPDGFFLMVEGSRIDHAAHAEDHQRDALDTIAYDKAVGVAIDFVKKRNNTILFVTADHETEGLVVLSHNLNSELPSDFISEEDKRSLRIERANNVTINWTATYHTNWSVPLFGYGTVFSDLTNNSTIDNTDIFTLMKNFYMGVPLNSTEEPPPTTEPTEPTEPTDTTTTTGMPVITDTTTTTATSTSTDEPTSTPGDLLYSSLILAAGVGAAVIIVVALFMIRRNTQLS
ncbi:MAG: alkaline phosphatase [Candidatus Thorarchaeota archaeon]